MDSTVKYAGWTAVAVIAALAALPKPVAAFGAGNISSLSTIEGKNWRHGDIEDTLRGIKTVKGNKLKDEGLKRVYFGNWLRDYSQALDVATLKNLPGESIRVLVWILGFMAFGYGTREFEVTADRLGVYRPEEHIDNPKGYGEGENPPLIDPRLRPPVDPRELEIDWRTGMKNYIANEDGGWATSTRYIRESLRAAIEKGREYAHGDGDKLVYYEALRLLGQGLHTLEDFGAHTNYTELALRELGFYGVFPHTGINTEIDLQGRRVFPLVTGTFGGVDFLHSVLGEVTDHVTQSEVDNLDENLGQVLTSEGSPLSGLTGLLQQLPGTRDLCEEAENLDRVSRQQRAVYHERKAAQMPPFGDDGFSGGGGGGYNYPRGGGGGDGPGYPVDDNDRPPAFEFAGAGGYPGGGDRGFDPFSGANRGYDQHWGGAQQGGGGGQWDLGPRNWGGMEEYDRERFRDQEQDGYGGYDQGGHRDGGYGDGGAGLDHRQAMSRPVVSEQNVQEVVAKIMPILTFRDNVVRTISSVISKIPGMKKLVNMISDQVTIFVMSLLAPFVKPLVEVAMKQLKTGSSTVISASAKHQFEPWTDDYCTDPTHSMLSKDHFSNILNEPAGRVAAAIIGDAVPRVVRAWEDERVNPDEVIDHILTAFHHPALRTDSELHRAMFGEVEKWLNEDPKRRHEINRTLGSESVRAGRNHIGGVNPHPH